MKRRDFLKSATSAATFVLIPSAILKSSPAGNNKADLFVYVGAYTTRGAEGIYICRYNQSTGKLSIEGIERGVVNPSFLAVDPVRMVLFAANEVSEFNGQKGGGVSAFRINKQSGLLSFINGESTGGAGPCNVTVNKAGTFVMVGNYSAGSLAVFPVMPDGRLGSIAELDQHTGSSIVPKRQTGPHVHCVLMDKANKHLLVTDLGIDKITIYPFTGGKTGINKSAAREVSTRPGAGPRHLAFSPDEKFLYAINELNSTITAYKYNGTEGSLNEIQTINTLPQDYSGTNSPADIHVHPSGKFLYGSNRGHDTIAVYTRDKKTGMLKLIEHVSTQGKNPRNFAIDPAGNFLLVANQDSKNIVSYRIDTNTGRISPTGDSIEIPAPVCVRFL